MRFLRRIIALLLLPPTLWVAIAPCVCTAGAACRSHDTAQGACCCHCHSCGHGECHRDAVTARIAHSESPHGPRPVDCPCQVRRRTTPLSVDPPRAVVVRSLFQPPFVEANNVHTIVTIHASLTRGMHKPPDKRIGCEFSFGVVRLLV